MVNPGTSRQVVDEYFQELDVILTKYNLKDKPESIYNVDESGISPAHSPPKVIGPRGRQSQSITSPRSTTTTLISCGNAIGTAMPPFIILKGQRMSADLCEGSTPGTQVRVSKSGWSNS